MDPLDLYALAEQEHIEVIPFPMGNNGSMSYMTDSGSCYIGIDASIQADAIQERTHLAHELGHCVTGSFYNRYAAIDSRQRHENRADKWAIRKLITVDELDDAVAAGCTQLWELAERFGVTEAFIRKAVCYYTHGNLATELYF